MSEEHQDGSHRPPPAPPPAPLPVQPLGYAGTGEYANPPGPRTPFVGRMAIGCFGYIALTVAWVVFAGKLFPYGNVVFDGWLVMTAGLLGLSLFLRRRYRFSGVGYGILSALGIGVLLVVGLVVLLIAICGKGPGK